MERFNNILLFAGQTKNENMPGGFYSSLALYPLRGKPVIFRQLEMLKNSYGIDNVIVVVNKDNNKLINYIKNILFELFNITLVLVNSKRNILFSLKAGLDKADCSLPTRVILGDTMLPTSIDDLQDVIYTSTDVVASENWCLVDNEGNYYDKIKGVELDNKKVLVGYYAFSNSFFLKLCCLKAICFFKKELSDLLVFYKKKYVLDHKIITDWLDLGHTSGLIRAKNFLFNYRSFNFISVDTELGLIIKESFKVQKLEDEALWYENLPNELKILTPRLISFIKDNNSAKLVQELYGYPTLQELYLSGEVNLEDWKTIIKNLFILHKKFEHYTISSDPDSLRWLYYDKTMERLAELEDNNAYWKKKLYKTKEIINGIQYAGIVLLSDAIKEKAEKLSQNGIQTIIHGDYCFSNILFDPANYIFKLIDPRGRLDSGPTIYGDPRYDIAKLRHSVVGLYDFIVHGFFSLSEDESGFHYVIKTTNDYSILEGVFDEELKNFGYDLKEIKFIEGLLFLSMIPLHGDNFNRQRMFYIKSIELLNNIINPVC